MNDECGGAEVVVVRLIVYVCVGCAAGWGEVVLVRLCDAVDMLGYDMDSHDFDEVA